MSVESTIHEDEYLVDNKTLRGFILEITRLVRDAASPAAAVAGLRPAFSRLLHDRGWLPDRFRAPCESGGMGGGIGQWLLYRSADRSLTLFSLVVPPGSATPVHDHLAWGLVGLYEGAQEETIYRVIGSRGQGHSELEPKEVRQLVVGDFYDLIPPDNDIHRVRTTSAIDGYRSPGRFATMRAKTASNSVGISGRSETTDGMGASRCFSITLISDPPPYGGWPVRRK